MALSIDNFDNGENDAGSVSSLTIGTHINGGGGMTLVSGDILLIMVGTSDPTSLRTVSSISDTGSLTWAKRGSGSITGGQFGALHVGGELWWAFSGSSQSGYTATIHMATAADVVCASIVGVKGFQGTSYHTAPFDPNGSLPNVQTATALSTPGAVVSTTNPNAMLIGGLATTTNAVTPAGSGYTSADGGLWGANGGFSDGVGTMIQYQVVSSTQTSAANSSGAPSAGWIFIGDALGLFGAAASAGGLHQIPSMGFG